MIAWLLKNLEKNPTSLFRKKELLKKSKKQFKQLKRQGFLTFVQPDPHHETYPCSIACSNTCPMEVVDEDGKLFAICPKDTEIDPIPLTKDDLSRYAFCLDTFLDQIRITNKIGGKCQKLGEHHIYMGYKTYDGKRVGIVFVFNLGDSAVLTFSGLKQICREDNILVVLTPAFQIEEVFLKERLHQDKIVQMSLASFVTFESFELPIDELVSDLLIPTVKDGGQYVLKRSGGVWQIVFEGNDPVFLPDELKGAKYLVFLIQNQGKQFSNQDIVSAAREDKFVVGKMSTEEALDEGLSIIRGGKRDLGKMLEDTDRDTIEKAVARLEGEAGQASDPAEKLEIQEKIEQIKQYLQKSTNIHGRPRKSADPAESQRINVRQRIDLALDKIKVNNEGLWQHLHNEMRKTGYKCYWPVPSIPWEIHF